MTEILIFWPKFRVFTRFQFLIKLSIIDQKSEFCRKDIFYQNSNFLPKFRFLTKFFMTKKACSSEHPNLDRKIRYTSPSLPVFRTIRYICWKNVVRRLGWPRLTRWVKSPAEFSNQTGPPKTGKCEDKIR